jgi:anti-anti-sigma factor
MKYEIIPVGDFQMVHLIGNINTNALSQQVVREISDYMRNGYHKFVFNLEQTGYLDSAGISIFIHCLCDIQDHKGSLYIIASESQVRDVLEMVGLSRLIKMYNSTDAFMKDHALVAT